MENPSCAKLRDGSKSVTGRNWAKKQKFPDDFVIFLWKKAKWTTFSNAPAVRREQDHSNASSALRIFAKRMSRRTWWEARDNESFWNPKHAEKNIKIIFKIIKKI